MTEAPPSGVICVPYDKRGRYLVLTIPFIVLLLLTILYLWSINPLLSLILVGFYLSMNYFQAYCCVHQDCPYVGQFCPAIGGIYLGNIIARRINLEGEGAKSEQKFKTYATIAMASWFLIALFPLYWILQFSSFYALGYLLFHIGYYLVFALTICPTCATRETCPGGALQKQVLKG